jgi:hypothetical protein
MVICEGHNSGGAQSGDFVGRVPQVCQDCARIGADRWQ